MTDMHLGVLFARIAWMESYAGLANDRPQGQMGYITHGRGPVAERFNFSAIGDKVYGYVTHTHGSLYRLGRIHDAGADADYLDGVLLVFMAARPRELGGGQFVVGWYRRARLYQCYKRTPRLAKRRGSIYCAVTSPRDAYLLAIPLRTWQIPTGPGGMGQTKIRYFDPNQLWMRRIRTQVNRYKGASLEVANRQPNKPLRRTGARVARSGR